MAQNKCPRLSKFLGMAVLAMATCGLFSRFSLKNPKRFRWSLLNQSKATQEQRMASRQLFAMIHVVRNFPDQKYVSAQTVFTKYCNLSSCWNFMCEFFALTSGASPRETLASGVATRVLAASQPPPLKQKNSRAQPHQPRGLLLVTLTCSKRWH